MAIKDLGKGKRKKMLIIEKRALFVQFDNKKKKKKCFIDEPFMLVALRQDIEKQSFVEEISIWKTKKKHDLF